MPPHRDRTGKPTFSVIMIELAPERSPVLQNATMRMGLDSATPASVPLRAASTAAAVAAPPGSTANSARCFLSLSMSADHPWGRLSSFSAGQCMAPGMVLTSTSSSLRTSTRSMGDSELPVTASMTSIEPICNVCCATGRLLTSSFSSCGSTSSVGSAGAMYAPTFWPSTSMAISSSKTAPSLMWLTRPSIIKTNSLISTCEGSWRSKSRADCSSGT
mmetsp:Transcript_16758/g.46155  ORF Transcript_16758/g.46155 Transcript_16758/m.46155 type:complete len:217 (-) Transcript_16758:1715-2365(-)